MFLRHCSGFILSGLPGFYLVFIGLSLRFLVYLVYECLGFLSSHFFSMFLRPCSEVVLLWFTWVWLEFHWFISRFMCLHGLFGILIFLIITTVPGFIMLLAPCF